MTPVQQVWVEGEVDHRTLGRSKGHLKRGESAARQCDRRVLVEDGDGRGRRSGRGRRPRQRCEAKEYDAKRPPPERKSVEHAT